MHVSHAHLTEFNTGFLKIVTLKMRQFSDYVKKVVQFKYRSVKGSLRMGM